MVYLPRIYFSDIRQVLNKIIITGTPMMSNTLIISSRGGGDGSQKHYPLILLPANG